ncbi:hypothetical protein M408DRAFT_27039, partial [Serendipita vermifera MAFF 305830]
HINFFFSILSNLESLIVVYKGRDPIANTIQVTTTGLRASRRSLALSIVDIYPISAHPVIEPLVEAETISRLYGERLDQISSLVLPNLGGNSAEVDFLPRDITKIECDSRKVHPFPHVRSYKLDMCTFAIGNKDDLGSLVRLTITACLWVHLDCHVFLPSLRFLSCGGIKLEPRSSIQAPALQQLHLSIHGGSFPRRIKMTEEALQTSSFGLLPNLSLVIKDCLRTQSIVQFLRRCGHVENASLTFSDEGEALLFIDDLFREEVFEHVRTGENSSHIKPRPIVSKLKLSLLSSQLDLEELKLRTAGLMRARRHFDTPIAPVASPRIDKPSHGQNHKRNSYDTEPSSGAPILNISTPMSEILV